jgi:hypothetical protein
LVREVFGFHIPTDDPLLVRSTETVCDLGRVIQRPRDGKRTISESRSQCHAREEFRYDVGNPVCGSDVEDREDGWVGEGRNRLAFTFEPCERVGIA